MLVCDHCGWRGGPAGTAEQPSTGDRVCPDCWAAGWVAAPRELMGPLMEAVLTPDPAPRTRKPIIDWTDEEYEAESRIERFKLLHESAPVYLPTTTNAGSQRGFDFMRAEFKVRGR